MHLSWKHNVMCFISLHLCGCNVTNLRYSMSWIVYSLQSGGLCKDCITLFFCHTLFDLLSFWLQVVAMGNLISFRLFWFLAMAMANVQWTSFPFCQYLSFLISHHLFSSFQACFLVCLPPIWFLLFHFLCIHHWNWWSFISSNLDLLLGRTMCLKFGDKK
jgi:hypothetical protein